MGLFRITFYSMLVCMAAVTITLVTNTCRKYDSFDDLRTDFWEFVHPRQKCIPASNLIGAVTIENEPLYSIVRKILLDPELNESALVLKEKMEQNMLMAQCLDDRECVLTLHPDIDVDNIDRRECKDCYCLFWTTERDNEFIFDVFYLTNVFYGNVIDLNEQVYFCTEDVEIPKETQAEILFFRLLFYIWSLVRFFAGIYFLATIVTAFWRLFNIDGPGNVQQDTVVMSRGEYDELRGHPSSDQIQQ